MKRTKRIIPLIAIMFAIVMGISLNTVYAANGKITNPHFAGNLFEATGPKGSDTDHTSCTYAIDNEPAWCIDAGVAVKQGEGYNPARTIDDSGALSWLMYHSSQKGGEIDNQIIQAAVWKLTGNTVVSVGGDMAQVDTVIAQAQACNNGISAPDAEIHTNSTNLKYDRPMNAYVSEKITASNGTLGLAPNQPFGARLEDYDGGKRIVVPATNVTSDATITVDAACTSSAQAYGPATVWEKSGSQTLITPSMTTKSGKPTSLEFKLIAVGDMKVVKKDEHGIPVKGATFRVTGGPDNINTVITTDDNGNAQLLEQRIGTYSIKEEDVPPTLVLNDNTFTITVKSGTMVTYDVEDEYERGELSIKKEDVFKRLGKKNYGDGTFERIKVGLYAAEDIYEGTTKVLSAGDLIAEREFNKVGETRSVKEFTRQDGKYFDGLPLGKYYWKELQTNEAYLMPNKATVAEAKQEKYEQTISYISKEVKIVPNQTTTMYDQERYGRVIVYKSDADNNNLSGKNDTDENPAVGAILRLTLKSNYNATAKAPIDPNRDTYTAEVDKYGRAEFVDPDFESKFGGTGIDLKNTIPFGDYVLDEIKTSNNGKSYYYGIQDTEVGVIENNKAYNVIVKDEPIPVFIEMVKRDADNDDLNGGIHEIVTLQGAGFKIWDCQAGDWLVQELPKTKEKIDTFITNNEGHCITPQKVNAGKFIIYEVDTPEGYYLNEEYRLPMDEKGNVIESQLGDEKYGGKLVDIRNISVYVSDAEEYPEGEGILDYEYINDHLKVTVTFEDNTTRGNIDVFKMGEVFADFTSSTNKKYEGDGYTDSVTEYTPKYEMQALANCKFEVWAVEDATTIDGRVKEKAYSKKHIITTDSTGHGICRNEDGTEDKLFCNPKNGTKYHIHEIESPAGYDLAEDQEVVVFPGTKYKQVEMKGLEVHDKYIPFNLKLDKKFVRTNDEDIMFKPANEINRDPAVAIFGLYSEQDLVATNGKEIPKDTLIQSLRVVEGKGYIESYKLPDGDYYLEELYTSEPYTILDKDTREPHRYDFTVVHKKDVKTEQDVVVTAENTYPTGDLYVVKISTTEAIQASGLTLKSNDKGYEEVREFTEMYSDEITRQLLSGGMNVDEALANVLTAFNMLSENGFRIVTPAKYGVYVDVECKIPLQQSDDGGEHYTDVVLEPMQAPDRFGELYYTGAYSVKGIQEGTYYLKELVPPIYTDRKGKIRSYELSKDITAVSVSEDQFSNIESVVLRVLVDDSPVFYMKKTDVFTDKGIPDCLFTITDKDRNELLRFVTNEEGDAYIPTDIFEDGETYYFTELDAPKYPYYDGDVLYELNTEPHKFIAHVEDDGRWRMEYVDEDGNVQEYEKIKIQNYRTTTGVELTKLDMVDSTPIPNCRFELKGIDTDFYETGVTDENGIYFFTDVPYGRYTYTELEAPEGWLIDTTPHEFTLDSHGTKIVVYDERKVDLPDTGDIAVAAIACVAVISVAGIVFLAIRKKKASSSK